MLMSPLPARSTWYSSRVRDQSAGAGGIDLLIARLPSDSSEEMVAGPFTFQDAVLTEGTASTLSVNTPSWGNQDASSLTNGTGTGLTTGDASALTSNVDCH